MKMVFQSGAKLSTPNDKNRQLHIPFSIVGMHHIRARRGPALAGLLAAVVAGAYG